MSKHNIDEDLQEAGLHLDEDDINANLRPQHRPRWLSVIVGIIIIGFFAFLLFSEDGSDKPSVKQVQKNTPVYNTVVPQTPNALATATTVTQPQPLTQSFASQVPPTSVVIPKMETRISQQPALTLAQLDTAGTSDIAVSRIPEIAKAMLNRQQVASTVPVLDTIHQQAIENDTPTAIDDTVMVPKSEQADSQLKLTNQLAITSHSPQKTVFMQPHRKIVPTSQAQSRKIDTMSTLNKRQFYTIQLVAMNTPGGLSKFVKVNHLTGNMTENLYFFKTLKEGKFWYVVTYGSYKNYKEAHLVIQSLPQNLQQAKPWPKRFASYTAKLTMH